jgi:hypothetical protein
MIRSRDFLILAWIGGIIAIPAIVLLLNTAQQRRNLESYRAELAAKGEKLKMTELAPAPHEGGTAAGERLIDVSNKLHKSVQSSKARPARLLFLGDSGTAEVAHLRPTAWTSGGEKSWAEFASELETLQPLLAELREAARPSELHLEPDYTKEFSVPLDFLAPTISASQQLSKETLLLLREGKISTAVDNIEAMLKLAAMLAEEPMMISQLVSISLIGIANAATWNVLQADASRPDLQRMLAAWERLRPAENLVGALRMERAWFEAFLNAKDPPPDTPGLPQPHPAAEFAWQVCARQKDEQLTLSDFQQIIDAFLARKSWSEIIDKADQLQRDAHSAGILRLVGAPVVSSISNFVGKFPQAESLQKLVVTAVAIRLYSLDHEGNPPDSLPALVPEYLKTVPTDPMDGKALRYQRKGSGFLLYAIGLNGLDESGNAYTSAPTRDILQRPDIVWPQPAASHANSKQP